MAREDTTRDVFSLEKILQSHGQGTAFLLPEREGCAGRSVSYGELVASVRAYARGSALRFRAALASDNPADRFVGILAERGVEPVAAFLGLMEAGFCPSLMEMRAPLPVLAGRMASVGMKMLLTDMRQYSPDCFPPGTRLASLEECREAGHSNPKKRTCAESSAGKRALRLKHAAPYASAPAMLLFTSGSTGESKGVVLSRANLICNAHGVTAMTGLTSRDVLLHVMPLHHTNGINNQIIAPLLAGAAVILADRFRPEEAPRLIDRYLATYMTGTPTHYSRILPFVQRPGARTALRSLRFLRCGSAPISRELHLALEAAFGVDLLVSYGLSEATCTTAMNPPGGRRIGTVGRVLEGQEAALFRPGTWEAAGRGEEGEICIRGGSVMLGYAGEAQDAERQGGWLRTGDLGIFDADGFLSVTGRIKDVILRGGENLSPALIEGILLGQEAVRDCCVVGLPSADLGEEPAAFVVLREGFSPAVEQDLRTALAEALPASHVPRQLRFVEELPRNALGKIERYLLRQSVV